MGSRKKKRTLIDWIFYDIVKREMTPKERRILHRKPSKRRKRS